MMGVDFKQEHLREEFSKLDFRVIMIVMFIAAIVWLLYGERMRITCIYRSDGGVHSVWRALDFGMFKCVPRSFQEGLRKIINGLFPYGDNKHETVPPFNHAGNATRSTADHWHVQVIEKERLNGIHC